MRVKIMNKTREAIESIESRVLSMQQLLADQIRIRDASKKRGSDITDMNRIVKAARDIISAHTHSAMLLKGQISATR